MCEEIGEGNQDAHTVGQDNSKVEENPCRWGEGEVIPMSKTCKVHSFPAGKTLGLFTLKTEQKLSLWGQKESFSLLCVEEFILLSSPEKRVLQSYLSRRTYRTVWGAHCRADLLQRKQKKTPLKQPLNIPGNNPRDTQQMKENEF